MLILTIEKRITLIDTEKKDVQYASLYQTDDDEDGIITYRLIDYINIDGIKINNMSHSFKHIDVFNEGEEVIFFNDDRKIKYNIVGMYDYTMFLEKEEE